MEYRFMSPAGSKGGLQSDIKDKLKELRKIPLGPYPTDNVRDPTGTEYKAK